MEPNPRKKLVYSPAFIRACAFNSRGAKFYVKLLAAVGVVLLLVIIILASNMRGSCWGESTCYTTACVDESSRIRRYMDTTVDPCEDFYQFACGNFHQYHQIPHGEKRVNLYSLLTDNQYLKIRRVLELRVEEGEPEYAAQARTFYRSCMNARRIRELGVKPLHDLLLTRGGWTVLDKRLNFSNFRLDEYWVNLSMDAANTVYYNQLFGIGVGRESENSEYKGHHIITLRQVRLGISKERPDPQNDYAEETTEQSLKARVEFITKLTHLLGQHQEGYDREYAENELTRIVDFEKELARIHLNASDLSTKTNRGIVTLGDLDTNFTGIDYKGAITKLFATVGIGVEDTDRVSVTGIMYFQKLGDLVQMTDTKTLAGYMMWRFIEHHLFIDLGPEVMKLENELNVKLNKSQKVDKPRNENCVTSTKHLFKVSVTKMFIDEYFKGGLGRVYEMTKRIKQTIVSRIYELDWLDKVTKDEAVERIRRIDTVSKIGFPEYMNDEISLAANVSKSQLAKISDENYFENMIKVRERETRRYLKTWRKLVGKSWEDSGWGFGVGVVYSGLMNTMGLSAASLYPPYFDNQGLSALNYGALGQAMGHEMTHALDSFTRSGSPAQAKVASAASAAALDEKTRCVDEVYGNITIQQIHVNVSGARTRRQNVADIAGLSQAFQAYQSWLHDNGPEKTLPAVNLTSNQLFFLGFAQMCCSIHSDEFLRRVARHYTPWRERTLGNVMNSHQFAQTYKCRPGARMNPRRKCQIW